MIENIVYLSPLIVLLTGILIILGFEYNNAGNSLCFKVGRFILLISFLLIVIFYNKALITTITQGSQFTLLFEALLYCEAFTVLYLSKKWFAEMNRNGTQFCYCVLLSVLCGCLLIETRNLLLTALTCILIMVNNTVLINQKKKELNQSTVIYMTSAFICTILILIALAVFYYYNHDLSYSSLRVLLEIQQDNPLVFIAVSLIAVCFVFLLGLAPLHFWFTEVVSESVLPIVTYFILVPSIAVLGCFIELNIYVFEPMQNRLNFFYEMIALISVGVGAIGACSVQNIRKIFAYGIIYHIGFLLLILHHFTTKALDASFVYWVVYLLSIAGICTTFFGLKVKGEYLVLLQEFNGASSKRPYVSAMMTVFIFSLIGLPPSLGFLGFFSILYRLAVYNLYEVIYILFMTVVLSFAYIKIIRTLYFEKNQTLFDRADRGIYTAMLFNAVIMILIMVKPYLVEDFVSMLEKVFE